MKMVIASLLLTVLLGTALRLRSADRAEPMVSAIAQLMRQRFASGDFNGTVLVAREGRIA